VPFRREYPLLASAAGCRRSPLVAAGRRSCPRRNTVLSANLRRLCSEQLSEPVDSDPDDRPLLPFQHGHCRQPARPHGYATSLPTCRARISFDQRLVATATGAGCDGCRTVSVRRTPS
jgi:hypothetical protein